MKRHIAKREARRATERLEAVLHAPCPPGYGEWLQFFFGRTRDSDDPWQMDWEFVAAPSEVATLCAYTFVNCGRDLAPFSDSAVAVGLKVLLDGSHSDVATILADASIEPIQRGAVIRSLRWLYKDCLALRSPPLLGHLSETQGNPLEYITYMLWDVSPLDRMIGLRDPSTGHSVLIETLRGVLQLKPPNPACIESVLHGFGHFACNHRGYREEVIAAIDGFLEICSVSRPELIAYAKQARTGSVL